MTRPTIGFSSDWAGLVRERLGGRQLVSQCPKCGNWRFGDGPHAPHIVIEKGVSRTVDCVGEVVP